MSSCSPKILVQEEHFCVAICTICHRIGLHYNNLLAGFDKVDFIKFSENVLSYNFFDYAMPFPPHGQLKTVIKTCHSDLQMAFDQAEFAELQDLLQEAVLLLETEEILGAF